MKVRIGGAACLVVVVCAGCGAPTAPGDGPPPVREIALTCPADIQISNTTGPTQIVTYPPPTATGGVPPITITCAPASNTTFPVGATTVTCNGTDGVRTGVCSFKVTLVPPQASLAALNYVAFGDSITAGENGEGSFLFIDGAASYPMQLLGMMQARYATQSPQVHNCGIPGEKADEGAVRLDRVLAFYNPDALLLLEGVNNITGHFDDDARVVRDALAHDIASARGRGMPGVFLSTLLPLFPGNCTPSTPSCRGAQVDGAEIVSMNVMIRSLASQQNVPLVDNYTAFLGHPEYIDNDGLHPLPLGNHALAQQFLSAIESKFETLASTARVRRLTPLAISPDCPHDGQTAVTVSRSSAR